METRDADFLLNSYDYDLPPEQIAQTPAERRDASRLLVLDRATGAVRHRRFDDLADCLSPGDLLVVNDTRVAPARLLGRKESGGRIELLVLQPYLDAETIAREGVLCLTRASKPVRKGSIVDLGKGFRVEVVSRESEGRARVRFLSDAPLLDILAEIGKVPLPPYIRREEDEPAAEDAASYQTVYARAPGAVAAPTAGLHFSRAVFDALRSHGVEIASVTLHVGYGTFSPIREEDIRQHRMHSEYAEISPEAAECIEAARRSGRRIAAVGTTSVRILEWVACRLGKIESFAGPCDHYIYPGYRFGVVGAMVTNFHLPKSSLLLLVSAFAGREAILAAYREAIRERYRFFSYGDAMLML
ncbi:MAG: tRNA preQ1(34) S-adenosylmethionine ribosyltransferase-isomerase QueA [Syntrophobacteraceae bacterium]